MPEGDKQPITIDFDHHGGGHATDPYPTYAKYRSQCPVAWSEHHGGYWVLFDYASVYAAARDDDTFRSGPSSSIPPLPTRPMIPMETDAPDTQKWRRMLYAEFAPSAVAELEPYIYEVAHALIDEFIERGECDYIQEFGTPLPAQVILRMLGFDPSRWAAYAGWVHDVVHGLETDPESAFLAAVNLYGEINEAIEHRREHGLTDDMISKLMTSTFDGEPVTDDDMADYIMLLIFGGLDTTTASLGNAMVRMHQQPHLRRQLLDRPELIPNAVEEFLRYDSPLQTVGRNISRDIEVGGQCLRAGDRALLVWASANRDEQQFPHADEIDFERTENRHLSFIVGLHRCLGSNLGRAMFRIMLELVLERTPDFELTEDPDRHRFADAGNVYALTALARPVHPRAEEEPVKTISHEVATAQDAPGALVERKTDVSKWFAVLGAIFLAVTVYVFAAWIISGDATPTRPGPDPIPGYVKAFAWVYQASGVVLLLGCVIYCWRKSKREGQLTLDAMIFFAWMTAMWLDPATNNFIRPNLLYNSYLINFGSWAPHIPGWLSPNAHLLPEPIVAYIGLYGVPGVLVAVFGNFFMRRGKRRWPHMGKLGTFLCGAAAIAVFDFFLEVFLIRTQMWSYPLAIRELSVFPGTRFQFPVYESFLFGTCWAATAALRYFKDDKGRSIVERGPSANSPSRGKSTAVRLLAVTGFVHLTYLIYSICFSWAAVYGGPYPEGYPSWMLNGICGPGTEHVCPGPQTPIPLPDSGPTQR